MTEGVGVSGLGPALALEGSGAEMALGGRPGCGGGVQTS